MLTADQRTDQFIGNRIRRSRQIVGHGEKIRRMIDEHCPGTARTTSSRGQKVAEFGRTIAARS